MRNLETPGKTGRVGRYGDTLIIMLLFMAKYDKYDSGISFMNRFEYKELKYHMLPTLSLKLIDF